VKKLSLGAPTVAALSVAVIWAGFLMAVALASGVTPLVIPVLVASVAAGTLVSLIIGPRLLRWVKASRK